MRVRRRAVSASSRTRYSSLLCEELASSGLVASAEVIAIYFALDDEIDLGPFIEAFASLKTLVAPKRIGSEYKMAKFTLGRLVRGHWGILEPADDDFVEPAEVDLWLVPGLAFTLEGERLGYGGGFYDRFFASARHDAPRVALAYPFQVLPSIPTESTDRKITHCLFKDVDL